MKRQSLEHHICCKIRVVGYPKNGKFWSGRLRCCRWCSSIFIEYQKVFFSQRISDCKVGGLVKKKQSFRHNICSKIKVVDYPKMTNSGMTACFAVTGVQICLSDTKNFLLPTYKRRQSTRPYRKTKLSNNIFGLKLTLWVIQK